MEKKKTVFTFEGFIIRQNLLPPFFLRKSSPFPTFIISLLLFKIFYHASLIRATRHRGAKHGHPFVCSLFFMDPFLLANYYPFFFVSLPHHPTVLGYVYLFDSILLPSLYFFVVWGAGGVTWNQQSSVPAFIAVIMAGLVFLASNPSRTIEYIFFVSSCVLFSLSLKTMPFLPPPTFVDPINPLREPCPL